VDDWWALDLYATDAKRPVGLVIGVANPDFKMELRIEDVTRSQICRLDHSTHQFGGVQS
jgi:hypothetical protein